MASHTENLASQDTHAFAMGAEVTNEDHLQEVAQDVLTEPFSPAARLAIIRRTFMALFHAGLIDQDADNFNEQLRWTAEMLGVPYAELWLAYYGGCMKVADIDRGEIAEWRGWCEQHAPDRLTVREWKAA